MTMEEQDDVTLVDVLRPVRQSRASRARRNIWIGILVAVWAVLAVLDVFVFHFNPGSSHAAATKPIASPGNAGHNPANPGAVPLPAPSKKAPASRALIARALVPVSASVYGPTGPASGDNSQHASLAIDASTSTAWVTDWYLSAQFGGLQKGTGLLLDFGHTVKVMRVRITLGAMQGADIKLLTGNVPALGQLRQEATASDVGGKVRLRLTHPVSARYLLLWFTVLPPDGSGTFQVSIYNVKVRGRP